MATTLTNASSAADRIKAYAVSVITGETVAGPHVRNACRRHLDDLKQGKARGIFFDADAAQHAVDFFEQVLQLSDAQFDGLPFILQPSQVFIVGSIFGWKYEDPEHGTVRRFRSAFIEEGKGNGKSPLAAGVGLYGLCADGEKGAQIYTLASHKDQAMIVFRDTVKMVRQSPRLLKRLDFAGGEGREYQISHLPSGSMMRALSRTANTSGSGYRPHMGLADEIHEMVNRAALDMTEAGFKFRREPLLFMITNSGSSRNSIAWEKHEHAIKVAAGNPDNSPEAMANPVYLGEPVDDRFFSYVCALDVGDDPLEDPACWIKANPLLGVILTHNYLAGIVKDAKAMPGKLNSVMRLNFCVWTDAATVWMPRTVLEPCYADFDPAEHHGKDVYLGLDLSGHRDLTALAAVVKTGTVEIEAERNGELQTITKPTFDAWIEAWTPGDTVEARAAEDRAPYDLWVKGNYLQAPPGQTIRFDHVAQAVGEYDREYRVRMLAYDRYSYRKFEETCHQLGVSVPHAAHPQAGFRRSKPTEEMVAAAKDSNLEPEGLWMPGSLRELEEALLEGRLRMRRNPVLISAMSSAATDHDKFENRWLAKARAANRIDAAVALCMAIGAATMQTEPVSRDVSPWEDPAFSLEAA